MSSRVHLDIGYLPIIDHVILGISQARDGNRFSHFDLQPVRFHSWPELAEALRAGRVDGGFIMAPYAMALKAEGVPIKTVLLGHREGLGFVVDDEVRALEELKGKTIGIPHKFSTHNLLLHQYLTEQGIDYTHDVAVQEVPPPEFVTKLAKGDIGGYFGSEPFAAQAEHQFVGKIQVSSGEIKKHHIDCILVMREEALERNGVIQELVNSLASSGVFVHEHPREASKIGARFLEQTPEVLRDVIHEKKMRVSAWDLLPIPDEFVEMQDYMVEVMHLPYQKIEVHDFVDSSFAKRAYEYLALREGVQQRRHAFKERVVLPMLVLVAALGLWQAVTAANIYPAAMLPTPLAVAGALQELWSSGALFEHTAASLYRVCVGFLLAAIVGIPLGLLLGAYRRSMYALDPLIQILRPISPIAWIPLAVLWFGVGDRPAIFIIFMASVFPLLLSSCSAVQNIDRTLILAASNFGTKGADMLVKVILPAAFPYIMVGIRISLGISWVIIVAAEMVGMRSGLGYLVLDARNFLRTDLIIAGMLLIGLIGFVIDRSIRLLEQRVRQRWAMEEAEGI